jgi:signal transduction histidine kinase
MEDNRRAMAVTSRDSSQAGDSAAERARTLQTLLLAGGALMAAGTLVGVIRRDDAWHTVFPYGAMLFTHALAYALSKTGHLRLAVTFHVSFYLAIVAIVMVRFGGLRSPAGFVLPPIVLVAGLTWNGRAALVTATAAAALTLGLMMLEQSGLLPRRPEAEPARLGFVIAATLVITGAILAVALRTIENAQMRALEHQNARLRLEERIAQARTLDTVASLAAGVAHDFNNILTVILGLSSGLRKSPDADAASAAQAIEEAAKRAATLTRLLMAFGRGQPVEARVLDINAVVSEAEPLLRRFAGDSRLMIELGADLPVVGADPTQLQQVLLNLVGNARDAMPIPGAVTIRTARASSDQLARTRPLGGKQAAVSLEVSDTGDGMSPEVQARVFEPFFTTKAPGKGTGIGLSAVREIVELTGGAISVESAQGKGSCFTILLPALENQQGGVPPHESNAPPR